MLALLQRTLSIGGLRTAGRAVQPNEVLSSSTMRLLLAVELGVALALWSMSSSKLIPTPLEVLTAFPELWARGLGVELWTSVKVNLEALAITTILSLSIAYATVLPAARPAAAFVTKLRFLGLAGLTFLFTLTFQGGHAMKVALLVFGMSVFFVTSMVAEIAEIPKSSYNHARTLRMKEWRVVYEVVVLGKLDVALDILRQNAAIGWMMLTAIEGLVRSEGGIGVMLLNQDRYKKMSHVFAIQITLLLVGIFQDFILGRIRVMLCPYADLGKVRK